MGLSARRHAMGSRAFAPAGPPCGTDTLAALAANRAPARGGGGVEALVDASLAGARRTGARPERGTQEHCRLGRGGRGARAGRPRTHGCGCTTGVGVEPADQLEMGHRAYYFQSTACADGRCKMMCLIDDLPAPKLSVHRCATNRLHQEMARGGK